MINPVNGRIVHYHPNGQLNAPFQLDPKQPLAAQVVHVFDNDLVNLVVFDSRGGRHEITHCRLLQDDAKPTELTHYCEWMPYQKGQAAKVDAR